MAVNEKINTLRKLMNKYQIDAYIIPSSDPHISEYVAEHWRARSWISGFTGSAGTLVVTKTESGLWTDGRYFIQAENQLKGTEIKLFKAGIAGVPSIIEWMEGNLKKGDCIGFPGKMVPVSSPKNKMGLKEMESIFSRKEISIIKNYDLVEEMWNNRPEVPSGIIFSHDIKFTGQSTIQKVSKVRDKIKEVGAEYYLISSLDDIAWLYNIRGNDIPNLPVAIAYALISLENAYLFIDDKKVPEDMKKILNDNGIEVMGYNNIESKLTELERGKGIAFDPERTSCWLYSSINPACNKIEIEEITKMLKAIKNETELINYKECQISDGIAMVKFFIWLEKNIEEQQITEITISDMLLHFRSQQKNNIGVSFDTIAAYLDHGAIIHYSANQESQYVLENKGLMVLDSGGQYLNGTTDITRTIVFKDISEEEKFDYTMTLKSHIALASTKFLYGYTGSQLDIIARKPLWDIGLNYGHGTGHGVGYCLSVHEWPRFSSNISIGEKIENGMLLTIEPGIYKEGKHGVRIENIYVIVEDEKNESGQFMRFEPMTYCPIDLRGVDAKLLTEDEKSWLNNYHAKVYNILEKHLDYDEKAWLKNKTMICQ